jgi:phospholipase A1
MIMMDLGYVHESNGQIQELSRSWNRFFIRSYFLYENFAANISLWAKIPEKDENSDNKDIQDFRGLGEINLIGVKSFNRFKLRLIPGFTNFGYELNYSIPWREGLRLSVRIGQGYGLSLQDYNHETNRISLGVELAHFL